MWCTAFTTRSAMTARGLVRPSVERGDGGDAGRWRLSFRIGRRWLLTAREDGMIEDDEFTIVTSGGRSF